MVKIVKTPDGQDLLCVDVSASLVRFLIPSSAPTALCGALWHCLYRCIHRLSACPARAMVGAFHVLLTLN